MIYAPCGYCRTEKPAPSGNCYNCGAPLLEVHGTYCGRPITNLAEWRRLTLEQMETWSGRLTHTKILGGIVAPLFFLFCYLLGYFRGFK